MTTAAHSVAPPDPIEPLQKAFAKIYDAAVYIFRRMQTGLCLGNQDVLPKPIIHAITRNPATARTRVQRALDWLDILHQTLKGSREHLRRFGPLRRPPLPHAARAEVKKLKAENRALRGLPPLVAQPRPHRPSTEDSRDLQRRARIRRILQNDTIGAITRRICHGLGIEPDSDSWPIELANNSETPERFLQRYPKTAPIFSPAAKNPPIASPPWREFTDQPPYHSRE